MTTQTFNRNFKNLPLAFLFAIALTASLAMAQQEENQIPQAQQQAAPTIQQQQIYAPYGYPVYKQPTTNIQATPLTESRTEQLRRARQDAELQTEQKIVEKLETSRMDDEKRRAEALFGDKNLSQPQAVPQQMVVVPESKPLAPVVDKESIKGEIREVLEEKELEKKKSKPYMSAYGGIADYGKVTNVKSNYSLGFGVGSKLNDHLLAEGSFLYSNFDVRQVDNYYMYGTNYPRITNLDQYTGSFLLKALLLDGMIHPTFGGAASYSYRQYRDQGRNVIYNNDGYSQAFDLGLSLGVEADITETMSLGVDYRYMWNLTYSSGFNDRNYWNNVYRYSNPLEKLNYSLFLMAFRAAF
jgi:opacity protein-like surface antigen